MKTRLFFVALFASSIVVSQPDTDDYETSLNYAQVTHVEASQQRDGSWCFDTTVRHWDDDWDHYADGWEVVDLEGNQLGYRLLTHPHENEQPFTRDLCGVEIPENVSKLIVRAKCNEHGSVSYTHLTLPTNREV